MAEPTIIESLDSPFRGCIHNVKCCYDSYTAEMNPTLYALMMENEIKYDLPLDAPLYAKLQLEDPDNLHG